MLSGGGGGCCRGDGVILGYDGDERSWEMEMEEKKGILTLLGVDECGGDNEVE